MKESRIEERNLTHERDECELKLSLFEVQLYLSNKRENEINWRLAWKLNSSLEITICRSCFRLAIYKNNAYNLKHDLRISYYLKVGWKWLVLNILKAVLETVLVSILLPILESTLIPILKPILLPILTLTVLTILKTIGNLFARPRRPTRNPLTTVRSKTLVRLPQFGLFWVKFSKTSLKNIGRGTWPPPCLKNLKTDQTSDLDQKFWTHCISCRIFVVYLLVFIKQILIQCLITITHWPVTTLLRV